MELKTIEEVERIVSIHGVFLCRPDERQLLSEIVRPTAGAIALSGWVGGVEDRGRDRRGRGEGVRISKLDIQIRTALLGTRCAWPPLL